MKTGFTARLEGGGKRTNDCKGREVSKVLEQKDSKWMEGEKNSVIWRAQMVRGLLLGATTM